MGGSLRRNNSENRVKPYGLILLLAFGATLLGVLIIQKLKERHIFNLLIKEKDREVSSLQHLLQKEQEYTQDMKKKNEELKANLFSLNTQKMDLERKLLEMHSTISSLRDEGNILESALQEQQTEIKLLREANANAGEVRQEVMTLKEILKQNEDDIEDLKHLLENPEKMSVSTDKGSTLNTNFNTNTDVGDIKKENNPLLELMEGEGYSAIRENGSQTTSIDPKKNENYSRTGDGSPKVVQLNGKRWKILATNKRQEKIRNLENDGAGRSSRVGPKEYQGGQINASVSSNAEETVAVTTGSNNLVEVERPENPESQVPKNKYPESYACPMETPAMTVEDDASYSIHKHSQIRELPQISGNREGSTDESLDGKTQNANENENHSQEISDIKNKILPPLKGKSAQEKTLKEMIQDRRTINIRQSF